MISLSKTNRRLSLFRYITSADGFQITWRQDVNRLGQLVNIGSFHPYKKHRDCAMSKRIKTLRANHLHREDQENK